MTIDNKFNIRETVFLITDTEQSKRIITAIQIDNTGILYRIASGTSDSWHYEFEISRSKDYSYS